MTEPLLHHPLPAHSLGVCGPDCRYRALYEGSQTSLTDMASRQRTALARHGRLRGGVITTLRSLLPRPFAELEQRVAARMSDVDDEALLAYMGYLLEQALAGTAPAGADLAPLRGALRAAGLTIPDSDDPNVLAAAVAGPAPAVAAPAAPGVPAWAPAPATTPWMDLPTEPAPAPPAAPPAQLTPAQLTPAAAPVTSPTPEPLALPAGPARRTLRELADERAGAPGLPRPKRTLRTLAADKAARDAALTALTYPSPLERHDDPPPATTPEPVAPAQDADPAPIVAWGTVPTLSARTTPPEPTPSAVTDPAPAVPPAVPDPAPPALTPSDTAPPPVTPDPVRDDAFASQPPAGPRRQVRRPAVKPELFPTTSATAAPKKKRKTPRTAALPAETFGPSDPPAAGLDDRVRNQLAALVATPRPVFDVDLVATVADPTAVETWKDEARTSGEIGTIPAKARHRLRGSLVVPRGLLRTVAAEFRSTLWCRLVEEIRGAKLYELGVLMSAIGDQVDAATLHQQQQTLRLVLRQPRGQVGVITVLEGDLNPGGDTRRALVEDMEELLAHPLDLIVVLAINDPITQPVVTALEEEATIHGWRPPCHVVSARSWEYADGNTAALRHVFG